MLNRPGAQRAAISGGHSSAITYASAVAAQINTVGFTFTLWVVMIFFGPLALLVGGAVGFLDLRFLRTAERFSPM